MYAVVAESYVYSCTEGLRVLQACVVYAVVAESYELFVFLIVCCAACTVVPKVYYEYFKVVLCMQMWRRAMSTSRLCCVYSCTEGL